LVDQASKVAAEEGLDLQRRLGCAVEWLSGAEVAQRFPPYASDQIIGATLGTQDGSVDPNAVVRGYRAKAAANGARYLEAEVGSILATGGQVEGIELTTGERLQSPVMFNAAGAWGPALLAPLGIELPVTPIMRTSYVIQTEFGSPLPSAFLPTGVYLISENAGVFNCGWSRPDDPAGFDFSYSRERFLDVVWPELFEWLPAFERLHLVRAWAGVYDANLLDSNAILGEWPTIRGLYLATGFSGHGFQQCHAVGRYLAELILGLPPTLDLARLGPQRIIDHRPLYEHAGRIL
jgi:glycine/D-amino acid oxidase-like deaminating enzyme